MSGEFATCPKCTGEMETGFLVDFGHARVEASRWVEGDPEPGWTVGAKTRGKRCYPVVSFRCRQCGYLESFAGAAEAPETTRCLECGTRLPSGESACPDCGWTYRKA